MTTMRYSPLLPAHAERGRGTSLGVVVRQGESRAHQRDQDRDNPEVIVGDSAPGPGCGYGAIMPKFAGSLQITLDLAVFALDHPRQLFQRVNDLVE